MLFRVLLLTLLAACALSSIEQCGRYHRQCGPNAVCDDEKKRCTCSPGYYGSPLVECHYPDQFQCTVKSDPHVLTFGDAAAKLNWPCKYRLTRIQHSLEGGTPGLAWCSTEVFGFNEVRNGKYFTSGVEISFSAGDYGQQISLVDDVLKFDLYKEGFRGLDGSATQWGTGAHGSFNGVNVSCTFDAEHRFAIFNVPRCGLRVKYRPFDPSEPTGPQSRVPAISIVVGKNTIFGSTELGRHPFSLCGMSNYQGSDEYQFFDRKMFLGLSTISQAVLYDVLHQNLKQETLRPEYTGYVLQNNELCQDAVDLFTINCTTKEKKKEAIILCTKILPKMADCAGINALEAFNGCLEAVCVDRESGCQKYKQVLESNPDCRSNKPRRVQGYCRGVTP